MPGGPVRPARSTASAALNTAAPDAAPGEAGSPRAMGRRGAFGSRGGGSSWSSEWGPVRRPAPGRGATIEPVVVVSGDRPDPAGLPQELLEPGEVVGPVGGAAFVGPGTTAPAFRHELGGGGELHRGGAWESRAAGAAAALGVAAAIVAHRHCRSEAVTASLDQMSFLQPIRVGQLAVISGRMTQAWHSSMEIRVDVECEDLLTGARKPTSTAYLTFVAIDPDGRPAAVPPLRLTTKEERRDARTAEARRRARLRMRNSDTRNGR